MNTSIQNLPIQSLLNPISPQNLNFFFNNAPLDQISQQKVGLDILNTNQITDQKFLQNIQANIEINKKILILTQRIFSQNFSFQISKLKTKFKHEFNYIKKQLTDCLINIIQDNKEAQKNQYRTIITIDYMIKNQEKIQKQLIHQYLIIKKFQEGFSDLENCFNKQELIKNIESLENIKNLGQNLLEETINMINFKKNLTNDNSDNSINIFEDSIQENESLQLSNFEEIEQSKINQEISQKEKNRKISKLSSKIIKKEKKVKKQNQKLKRENNTLSKEICCICFQECIQDQKFKRPNCKHYFHLQCVDDQLLIKKNCPFC